MPGKPQQVYASMGNYLFSARTLLREIHADARRHDSTHDFGRDILPSLLGRVPMYAYDFQASRVPGEPGDSPAYWRDVGTLDAYYEAHMDLCGLRPALNLYNRRWPIRTASYPDPSANSPSTSRGVPARRSVRSCQTGACWLADASAMRSWAAMCTSTAARSSRTRSFLTTARSATT